MAGLLAALPSPPTHKSHPDTGRGKLDEREIVGVVLFEARGDSSKVLELVEEALHEIAQVVEKGAESWPVHAPGYGLDVGPGAALGHARAQGVAVIGAVAEQDLARTEGAQHVGGALAVVGLAGAELQGNRIAVGIDEGVDLGRQPAPRAPHASGSRVVPRGGVGRVLEAPLLTLAAC